MALSIAAILSAIAGLAEVLYKIFERQLAGEGVSVPDLQELRAKIDSIKALPDYPEE